MNIRISTTPVIILLILSLASCIDPFFPRLEKYQSLLVVDALLTDDSEKVYVKLSRTFNDPDKIPEAETGAQISISDNQGNITFLFEDIPGIYLPEPTGFCGYTGTEYRLSIQTADGKHYLSESSLLQPAGEIKSVYFDKASGVDDNGDNTDGIMIYIDSYPPEDAKYLRWSYEEWWKFEVPYPVTHKYIDEDHIYEIPVENSVCFKNNESAEVLLSSLGSDPASGIIKNPVCYLTSTGSDRFLIQYWISVNQYSVSADEYEFWRQMKEINASGGDIFDRQPFEIISNIRCVSNEEEMVLGYFQVSGVSRKSIYIKRSEVDELGILPYQYNCSTVLIGPQDFLSSENPITFDRLYNNFTMQGFVFVSPQYVNSLYLDRLFFADKSCSDCTTSGSLIKPDFWTDLN